MNVRDLNCWPPEWGGSPRGSRPVATSEDGILIGVRWDLNNQSLALTLEHEGERYSAVLRDDVGSLTKLYLLLGWHVGRPLAKIGSLEIAA
jgi:hypothetical protein